MSSEKLIEALNLNPAGFEAILSQLDVVRKAFENELKRQICFVVTHQSVDPIGQLLSKLFKEV